MARIRSVHPSLFTDEAWVSCSPLARILYIGLMTDADDQGLFEWKPLQIKMRLLAGDAADVPALLEELVAGGLIAQLDSGGKKLGAIRYFRRFQRPKKPTSHFVLPPEWTEYVGLKTDGSEPSADDDPMVENQLPTSSENPPQMEDGGGRMDKNNHTERWRAIDKPMLDGLEAKLREAAGPAIGVAPALMIVAPILGLLRPGQGPPCDLEADVLPVIRAKCARAKPGSVQTWGYFTAAIIQARDQRLAGAGRGETATEPIRLDPKSWPASRWRAAVDLFREGKPWPEHLGPPPGSPGCWAPAEVTATNLVEIIERGAA